jgi:hypothetical protein
LLEIVMRRRLPLLPALCLVVPCLLSTGARAGETVWFEVASTTPRVAQSYLLPLSDAEDIAAARTELAFQDAGGRAALILARIRPGGDGLNRNLRDAAERLWSWHVTDFGGFADFAAEICDGSPSLVEADPEGFTANTGGMICFWGYALAAELAGPPLVAISEALDGFWHSPGSEGSGFLIDVLEAQQSLALAWLRYAPVGAAQPEQQWLLGLGTLPSDPDASSDVQIELAQPAPAVDGEVPMMPVVSVRLEFHDCNHGELLVEQPNPARLALQRTVPRYGCNPD